MFRVPGFGFRVSGFEFWVFGFGFGLCVSGFEFGLCVSGFGCTSSATFPFPAFSLVSPGTSHIRAFYSLIRAFYSRCVPHQSLLIDIYTSSEPSTRYIHFIRAFHSLSGCREHQQRDLPIPSILPRVPRNVKHPPALGCPQHFGVCPVLETEGVGFGGEFGAHAPQHPASAPFSAALLLDLPSGESHHVSQPVIVCPPIWYQGWALPTRWSTKVSFPPNLEGTLTRFEPHMALKVIAWAS